MEVNNLHVHMKELEFVKAYFNIVLTAFEDGASFFITTLDKVTYIENHKFEIPGLQVDGGFSKSGPSAQAIQARKVVSARIPRNVYGVRLFTYSGPIWNENDTEIIGAWALTIPRQHKIVNAFESFAPVVADLLPEGGFMWITDKEKFLKRQPSQKFDMLELQVGNPLRAGSTPDEAIKQKKLVTEDIDESVYGYPVIAASYPLMDEETGEAVGAFGISLPRKLADDLKHIASSLDEGLTGVATAIEQITAATNNVSDNQQQLHGEIGKSKELLDKINDVMNFIKEIADETKMLGLNAAIEAARVGEAGLGFGVVAEEIRKLSADSKNTVVQIKELTKEINKSMNETAEASESTLAVVEETAAATQEVNASIEEMTALAQKLSHTAADL
ncbi:archaellum component FlaC [Sporomusaceae bacterium BoRhaA]|uniref:methyl-accepting chemotaxis protein n=1 Tax=Pelorhabdus rhamnosifermentans TaxID=2772457 RepID=UPI001C062689|nr:methyl-accepting chemotaxis protein [Pelorhabdus rhamnosifermentans]MBU2702112.1 archaellum component FlaC [Pelorhabdus rhamnosifermentans]